MVFRMRNSWKERNTYFMKVSLSLVHVAVYRKIFFMVGLENVWALVGLRASLAVASLHWPLWAVVGLCWPSLAFVGLCWPMLA